jgi:hypothetical protein
LECCATHSKPKEQMMPRSHLVTVSALAALLAACGGPAPDPKIPPPPPMPPEPAAMPDAVSFDQPPPALHVAPDIDQRLAKFATLEMTFDDATIAPEDRPLIKKLVEVNRLVHDLFIQQIDTEIPTIRQTLAADPSKAAALRYFDIMAGPWDSLAHDEPFVGTRKRPPGGTFYPADLSKEQFEQWVAAHPQDKDAFQGFFSVIRRGDSGLVAVPYAQAYKDRLTVLSARMKEAATLAREPTLKSFLDARADAFLSNEYRESDKAWMDVKGPFEVTIGPYETYADQLLGLKASFESFISVRDQAESRRLEVVGKKMDALENNLPIPQDVRKRMTARSQGSPIDVVHLLCNAGQQGVQTVAYNLPNDEMVRKEKGSKKVMMKNVLQGKFDRIMLPISERVLTDPMRSLLNSDAVFSYILMHEVAHGLGPGILKNADGSTIEVQKALKELYGGIEEAKADIAGLVSAQYLIDAKVFPKAYDQQIYVAYLATVFRQVRFGVKEAHGRAAVASFNYLFKKGGIVYDDKAARYAIDFRKIKGAVRDLAREYLTIEGHGDYAAAKRFLDEYAVVSPEMQKALDSLGAGIPVDIAPVFPIYDKAKAW